MRVPATQASERVSALFEEIKTLKKQASRRTAESKPSASSLFESALVVQGVRVIVQSLEETSADDLRHEVHTLRKHAEGKNLAVLLLSATDGKVNLAAGLTADLVTRGLHAGNWLKTVAPVVSGGGGGRPDFAQAGGKDVSKIPAAIEQALGFVKEKLG